jgi:hypothetical protein
MFKLVTTRFNTDTWNENETYRKKKNCTGCIYGSPKEMPEKIEYGTTVCVIEMNNTSNHIEGIGIIQNKPVTDKYCKIYSDNNYNRFTYMSNFRLDREELLIQKEELVRIFDHILFKEKTHLKRGYGFTTVPEKLLNHELCKNINIKKEIQHIFMTCYKNGIDEERQEQMQEQMQECDLKI